MNTISVDTGTGLALRRSTTYLDEPVCRLSEGRRLHATSLQLAADERGCQTGGWHPEGPAVRHQLQQPLREADQLPMRRETLRPVRQQARTGGDQKAVQTVQEAQRGDEAQLPAELVQNEALQSEHVRHGAAGPGALDHVGDGWHDLREREIWVNMGKQWINVDI